MAKKNSVTFCAPSMPDNYAEKQFKRAYGYQDKTERLTARDQMLDVSTYEKRELNQPYNDTYYTKDHRALLEAKPSGFKDRKVGKLRNSGVKGAHRIGKR